MDLSKEYIKMCDCPEIQGLRKGLSDDIIYSRYEDKIYRVYEKFGIDSIWLPRQDQLQEMASLDDVVIVSNVTFILSVEKGRNFSIKRAGTGIIYAKTLEQLWLAFVMKEKHNKTWNGETWT